MSKNLDENPMNRCHDEEFMIDTFGGATPVMWTLVNKNHRNSSSISTIVKLYPINFNYISHKALTLDISTINHREIGVFWTHQLSVFTASSLGHHQTYVCIYSLQLWLSVSPENASTLRIPWGWWAIVSTCFYHPFSPQLEMVYDGFPDDFKNGFCLALGGELLKVWKTAVS